MRLPKSATSDPRPIHRAQSVPSRGRWGALALDTVALDLRGEDRQQPARSLTLPALLQPEAASHPATDATQAPPPLSRSVAPVEELGHAKRVLITVQQAHQSTGLRLALRQRIPGRFVWLHEAADVKRLLTQLQRNAHGEIALTDGPLREIFRHGGTLFIDYHGFTQPEAESLNELFARVATYGGAPVHPELRIIGTVPQASVAESRWSPAFLNRFQRFLPAPAHLIATDPVEAIGTASAEQLQTADAVIDLHSARPWPQLVAAHVRLDAQGALQWVEAPLAALLAQGKSVVLRNAPLDNAHFVDFMRGLVLQHGASRLAYFAGYTEAEQSARMLRHRLVTWPAHGRVHTVTAQSFVELFEQTVVRPAGHVAMAPGLLTTLPQGQVLHIATPLLEAQWNALLNHPTPLTLSIASTAQPPQALADRLPQAAPPRPTTPVDLRTWVPRPGSATVLHTQDADAAAHALCTRLPRTLRVDVDSDLQADELLQALRKQGGRYHFAARPMAEHLAQGGVVLLRGLEHHVDLQQGLAALLMQPTAALASGAVVVLQSPQASPLLAQVPTQHQDITAPLLQAERIAQALAQPGLDAATVNALLDFARGVQDNAGARHLRKEPPRLWGLAFMRTLAAYHASRMGAATLQSWGHSLADLLRHESGADNLRTADITDLANTAFGRPPQAASNTLAECQATCVRILRHHRAVFLQGPPGAGKSYQAQAVARTLGVTSERLVTLSVGPTTTRADLLGRDAIQGDGIAFEDGPVATWARDTRPGVKLLVVDEANLPAPGFWQFLRGAFDVQPALLIDGTPVPLSADHKIIFTGNDDHVVGRFVHPEIRDCFITQHFAAYTPTFLHEQIALPTLRRLAPQLPAAQLTRLAQQAIDLHRAISHLPEGLALSPRNLEEALVRAAHALSQNNTPTLHALSDAYAGLLAPEARAGLHSWQTLTAAAPPRAPAHTPGPNASGIVWTRSTRALAHTVDAFLDLRAWRQAHAHSAVGQVGLLVQGPSGRGKDEVVAQRLQARGVVHTVLNAGMDYASFAQAIHSARIQGSVVVLSEMNLLPAGVLEGRLNDALSGPGTHPGFAVIATLNPPTFSGRSLLSDALLNRFVVHKLGDYDAQEVQELVHDRLHLLRSPAEMAHLTQTHNDLVRDLQRIRSPYAPTARELVRAAERLASDPALAVQEVIDEVYALHRSVPVPALQQNETEHAAPALSTLANLIEPGHGWRVVLAEHVGPRGATSGKRIAVNAAASEAMQQAQVLWQLLTTESQFATPHGAERLAVLSQQLQAAAVRYPALAAQFAQMRALLPAQSFTATRALNSRSQSAGITPGPGSGSTPRPGSSGSTTRPGSSGSTTPSPGSTSDTGTGSDTGPSIKTGPGPGTGDPAPSLGSSSLPDLLPSARTDSNHGTQHLDGLRHGSVLLSGAKIPPAPRGTWSPAIATERGYLGTHSLDTFLPNGTMMRTLQAADLPQPDAAQAQLGTMELLTWPTVYRGKRVAELLVPTGQQPMAVSVALVFDPNNGGNWTATPTRVSEGFWLVDLPEGMWPDALAKLHYGLVAAPAEDPAGRHHVSAAPLPFSIDYAAWPQLEAFLEERFDVTQPEQALRSLQAFFNTHVGYSLSADVRDFYLAGRHLPLVNQLLNIRAGCCFETAHAFAAIARDLLGAETPVRLTFGHMASAAGLSAGHAWVEAHLPVRGWTVFDPTGDTLDSDTLQGLAPDDMWPLHVMPPLSAAAMPPLHDAPPVRHGARTVKRSAVAAEIAPAFTQALSKETDALLFNAALEVRESFAQIPGRLDVERLVRGEVDPFVSPAVGRGRAPKSIFLSASHAALRPDGDSAAHETLRALLALQIPVHVFDSTGQVTPVHNLAEAMVLHEPVPQNVALAKRYRQALGHYAEQLKMRPAALLSLDISDALFHRARKTWVELAQGAASLPAFSRPDFRFGGVRNGHLVLGEHGVGLPEHLNDALAVLQAHAYATKLEITMGLLVLSPANYDTLVLPCMPNLRHLHILDYPLCKVVVPHQQGALHVQGSAYAHSHPSGSWIDIYTSRPHEVFIEGSIKRYVRVHAPSRALVSQQAPREQVVQEPLEFLRYHR